MRSSYKPVKATELNPESVEIIELIKKTMLGGVYQGVLEKTQVAVRIVKYCEAKMEPSTCKEILAKEVERLNMIQHPHLLDLYGVFYRPAELGIVTKYAGLGTLLDKIKTGSTFKILQLHLVTHDICAAMLYLEKVGFTHKNFGSYSVYLEDFNHVKVGGLVEFGSEHSNRNNLDVKRYQAPEIMDQRNEQDSKSVLYSLGLVFWELSAWQLVYDGLKDSTEIRIAKMKTVPRVPKDPMKIQEFLKPMVSRDRTKRSGLSQLLFYLGERLQGDFPQAEEIVSTTDSTARIVSETIQPGNQSETSLGTKPMVNETSSDLKSRSSFPSVPPVSAYDQGSSMVYKPGLIPITSDTVVAILNSS